MVYYPSRDWDGLPLHGLDREELDGTFAAPIVCVCSVLLRVGLCCFFSPCFCLRVYFVCVSVCSVFFRAWRARVSCVLL